MSLPIPPHQDSLGTECVPPSMTAFSITKTSSMSSLIQLASASLHLTWILPSCREPEMKLTLTVHSSVLPQNFNHNWKLSFTIQSNNHKFQGLKHGLLFWNVAYCYFYVCVCPCLLDCIYVMHISGTHRSQKKVWDPLELPSWKPLVMSTGN